MPLPLLSLRLKSSVNWDFLLRSRIFLHMLQQRLPSPDSERASQAGRACAQQHCAQQAQMHIRLNPWVLTQSKTRVTDMQATPAGPGLGVWYTALTAPLQDQAQMSQSSGLQALAQLWGQAGRLSACLATPTLQLHEVILAAAARLCAGTKGAAAAGLRKAGLPGKRGSRWGWAKRPRFRMRGPRLRPSPPRWTHPRGTLDYLFSFLPARPRPACTARRPSHSKNPAAPRAAARHAQIWGPTVMTGPSKLCLATTPTPQRHAQGPPTFPGTPAPAIQTKNHQRTSA